MAFIYDPRKNQNGYAVEPTVRPSYAPGVSPGLIDVGVAAGGSPTPNNPDSLQKPDTTKPDTTKPEPPSAEPGTFNYTPSDAVTQAEALLQQHLSQKPGEYKSTWSGQLADTVNQILNREDFSYNLNEDALYQQLKDQYVMLGQQASMDAMGRAAAMTGGYGNSYAQSVGQQAYQGYLQGLNDKIPELYQLAIDQHNQEGQEMYDRASLLAGMNEQEYGRYRDTVSDYYTELNYLNENAKYMSETEYQRALNDFNIKYGSYSDTNEITTEFHKAIFSRIDANGNYIYYIDGKERTYAPGVNPYTGTKNSDTEYGTFSNGYQPNNINGQKLSKSGITDVVNGVTQNVWKTPDGKLWIWDGTKNRYLEYMVK